MVLGLIVAAVNRLDAAVTVSNFISVGYPFNVNLTEKGPNGWIHWGNVDESTSLPGTDRMEGGAFFSDYVVLNGSVSRFFNDDNINISWSNGTVVPVQPDVSTGIISNSNGYSVSFTMTPPNLEEMRVFVYFNLFNTTATLTATSESGFTDSKSTSAPSAPIGYFQIDFTPTSLTDVLTINLAKTADGGNIVLYGAALVAPEPGKAILFLSGIGILMFRRQR